MTPLDKAKNSKTFCILPWVHQYVGPPGDVKPCCVYEQDMQVGDYKKNTLKEIWNNDATRQVRVNMLDGKEIPGCAKCNSRENLTTTHRDNFNQFYFDEKNYDLVNSTLDDGTLAEHSLQYIDVRFNNLCNLKCRTCGPRFSTSWIEDHAALYNVTMAERAAVGDVFTFPGKTAAQLLTEVIPLLPNVRQIYFAGGEPLMQNDHYLLLEELIRTGHTGTTGNDSKKELNIFYNTNFSMLTLGKFSAIEFWKQFASVKISASIDGSHARAEYWRKGTKWDTILANRKQLMLECPNVEFSISYTTSWVSVFNLVDLHKEWVELQLIGIDDIAVNLLDTPTYYSLQTIPLWKKQTIEKLINEHITWLTERSAKPFTIDSFANIITFMYSAESESFAEDFLKYTDSLDKLRSENFWEIYPEHADIKKYLNV